MLRSARMMLLHRRSNTFCFGKRYMSLLCTPSDKSGGGGVLTSPHVRVGALHPVPTLFVRGAPLRWYNKYRTSLQQEEVARNYEQQRKEMRLMKQMLQLKQNPHKAAMLMQQAQSVTESDPKRARVLLMKLAKLKHVPAMVSVAQGMWFGDLGFAVDKSRALQFMDSAADLGSSDAKEYLAIYMKESDGALLEERRKNAREMTQRAPKPETAVSEADIEAEVERLVQEEARNILSMNVNDLKEELKKHGLPVTGAKIELAGRLHDAMHAVHRRELHARIAGGDIPPSMLADDDVEWEEEEDVYMKSNGRRGIQEEDVDDEEEAFLMTNAEEETSWEDELKENEEDGANEIWEEELLERADEYPASDLLEAAEDILYASEEGVESDAKNLAKCLTLLAKAAIRRNPEAMWRLAELALLGKGFPRGSNVRMSYHYVSMACDMDCAPTTPGGMLALAHAQETGFGKAIGRRHLRALYWYEQAANAGYTELAEEGIARVHANYKDLVSSSEGAEDIPPLPATTSDVDDVDDIKDMMRIRDESAEGDTYDTHDEMHAQMQKNHPDDDIDEVLRDANGSSPMFGMPFGGKMPFA